MRPGHQDLNIIFFKYKNEKNPSLAQAPKQKAHYCLFTNLFLATEEKVERNSDLSATEIRYI